MVNLTVAISVFTKKKNLYMQARKVIYILVTGTKGQALYV